MARKDREIAQLVTPGRLDSPIIVLRRVNVGPLSRKPNKRAPSVMERIGSGYIEQGVEEKETVWFADGLLINDQPREAGLTDEIMANTIGFAIANTETGEVMREELSLAEAQRLADSATISVNVDLDFDEDEDDEAEAVAAAVAAAAAEAAATRDAVADADNS